LAAVSDGASGISQEAVTGGMRTDGFVMSESRGFGFAACRDGACLEFQMPGGSSSSYRYGSQSDNLVFGGRNIVAANFGASSVSDLVGQTPVYVCDGEELTITFVGLAPIRWGRIASP